MKPISKTAFVCCGLRMADAESDDPICGDVYARRFMEGEGLRILSAFDSMEGSGQSAAANVTRHRIIDDLLRGALGATPDLLVVVLGAGFESRAYRLPGGTWVELDEPQVMAPKDARLPASECKNPLYRILRPRSNARDLPGRHGASLPETHHSDKDAAQGDRPAWRDASRYSASRLPRIRYTRWGPPTGVAASRRLRCIFRWFRSQRGALE